MSHLFKGQFQFLLTEYWIVRPSKVILWRRSLSDFFAVSGENAISKWRRTSTRIPTSICPLCTARSAGDLEFESNKWGRIPMLSILFVAFVDATVVILPWTLQYSELLWINWKVNMRTHNDLSVSLFESLQQKKARAFHRLFWIETNFQVRNDCTFCAKLSIQWGTREGSYGPGLNWEYVTSFYSKIPSDMEVAPRYKLLVYCWHCWHCF